MAIHPVKSNALTRARAFASELKPAQRTITKPHLDAGDFMSVHEFANSVKLARHNNNDAFRVMAPDNLQIDEFMILCDTVLKNLEYHCPVAIYKSDLSNIMTRDCAGVLCLYNLQNDNAQRSQ